MAFPRPHALGGGNRGNGDDWAEAHVLDNPYGGPHAAPSNPAWRYCPDSARTPSPKPMCWPPQALSWPAGSRGDGFSPTAPVISRVPMKDFLAYQAKAATMPEALPAVPKLPCGFKTPSPRRRMRSPPSIRGPPSPSPKSSDVSEVSLGKSGYKYSPHGHRDASLPGKIVVTPPSSSSNGSLDTTLPLTPTIEKYVLNKRGQKRGSAEIKTPSPTDSASSKAPLMSPLVQASASASASSNTASPQPGMSVTCKVNVNIGQPSKSQRKI